MTGIKGASKAGFVGKGFQGNVPTFQIVDHKKGYTIVGDGVKNRTLAVLQGTATFAGAIFLAAAIGLFIVPVVDGDTTGVLIRNVAAVIFASIAAYMLWFSSRGSIPEVQVDRQKAEICKAIRNKAGRATIIDRYAFESIGGVFIDRSFGGDNEAQLLLRYKNTPQTFSVACGPLDDLEALRNRIGQDLIVRPTLNNVVRIVPRRVKKMAA